jgi:hypothetical protein
MKIKSYYINIRNRWSLIAKLWNKFFSNLEYDYEQLKIAIDDIDNDDGTDYVNEEYIRNEVESFILEEEI